MKTIQRCFLLSLLGLICLLSDCSKSNDPAATSTSGSSSSSINGTATTFMTSKATDTGAGLEIVLADNIRKITMSLGDKTANTYQVKNTSSGRSAASTEVTITVVIDNVVYYGVSGSVVTILGADGKLSGTFDIVLRSNTGLTLTILGGKISGITIGAVPTGCKISSITYSAVTPSACDSEDSFTFAYNGDGKISRITGSNGASAYYSYDVGGKLAAISTISSATQTYSIEFSYSGTILTSYKERSSSGTYVYTDNYVISYNGTAITSITDTHTVQPTTGGLSYSETINFTNTAGNLSSYFSIANITTGTFNLKNYDTKKNPFQLLAQLSGTPVSFFYGGYQDKFKFFCLSANNPTAYEIPNVRTDAITYTYNAQNYPTNIRYAYGVPYNACVQNFAIVYSGCQ